MSTTTRAELVAAVGQSSFSPTIKTLALMAIANGTPDQLDKAGALIAQVREAIEANDPERARAAVEVFSKENGIPPAIASTIAGMIHAH